MFICQFYLDITIADQWNYEIELRDGLYMKPDYTILFYLNYTDQY